MAMRPVSVPRDVEVIHKTSINVFFRLAAAHLALSHIHKLSASDGGGLLILRLKLIVCGCLNRNMLLCY